MSLPSRHWTNFLPNLCLDKRGVVVNQQLKVAYNLLVLIAIFLCGAITWNTKGFMSKLPVKVSPNIHYRAVYQNTTQYPVCQTPSGWLNKSLAMFEREWQIFREPCYYSCGLQGAALLRQNSMDDCMSPEKLAITHTYQDVFLRTAHMKYYHANDAQRNFFFIEQFYPFAEDMGFDLTYTYYVDTEPAWFFGLNPKRTRTDAVSVSGTNKHATTILLDATGAVYKIFVKPPRIRISMRDLITLAQRTPLTLRGDQHLPTEVLRSGISISVEVKCFNDAVDLHYLRSFGGYHRLGKIDPTTKQPACVMSFVKVSDEAIRNYGEFVERTFGFNVSALILHYYGMYLPFQHIFRYH